MCSLKLCAINQYLTTVFALDIRSPIVSFTIYPHFPYSYCSCGFLLQMPCIRVACVSKWVNGKKRTIANRRKRLFPSFSHVWNCKRKIQIEIQSKYCLNRTVRSMCIWIEYEKRDFPYCKTIWSMLMLRMQSNLH